jgi:hypothetical protein
MEESEMKRELFIEAINAIDKQFKVDIKFSENLGVAFPHAFTANLLPDNSTITDSFIKVLEQLMNDKGGWINWFCYETEFGREQMEAYDEEGKPIPLGSAGELYDFLTK